MIFLVMDEPLMPTSTDDNEHSRFQVNRVRSEELKNSNSVIPHENGDKNNIIVDIEDDNDKFNEDEDSVDYGRRNHSETWKQFFQRHRTNIFNFFIEDWGISGMLGIITAILSIALDVGIEYLLHLKIMIYDAALSHDTSLAFFSWIFYITALITIAALSCHYISKQAIGSGIPEVKVIMNGFDLPNYLTFKTLIAKTIGLLFTLGSGFPVGKEGPFVHMGAIVGTLLMKCTYALKSIGFYDNFEGRKIEILSSGCAVGIACTFSAPAGAVLYGIESTHKYFAVKNYWRAFFATTCSALVFRFANAAIIPPHIAGTITAYYQTYFPNEVFLVEELPVFALIGVISGVFGALFVYINRQICVFKMKNKIFKQIFGDNNLKFTIFMAIIVGLITYPEGFGSLISGKLSFRETLADFISNCTMTVSYNGTDRGCNLDIINRWIGHETFTPSSDSTYDTTPSIIQTLLSYLIVNYLIVAICITTALPAGIFVPSFVIGACGGRIIGELMALLFPEGIRGPDAPQIYPGLYAVVGAAAYTGSVTHSLSIAVIVCETTGQLSPLLPVLIALMVGNAISSFLQPSIYESIIIIKKYPHLAELPPSRISVHTMKIDKIMIKDVVSITRSTTYGQLREILRETPHLRSYPLVTDTENKILLGSVSRKYLIFLINTHCGYEQSVGNEKRKSKTASEIFGAYRRNSSTPNNVLNDRSLNGSHLLSISPLHNDNSHGVRSPLAPLIRRQQNESEASTGLNIVDRLLQLRKPIDLEEIAIDPAPFQMVLGTSLYKVHTLFSLLGLNHSYVTHHGRLVGVVSLRELRHALAHVYSRGAVAPTRKRKQKEYELVSRTEPGDSTATTSHVNTNTGQEEIVRRKESKDKKNDKKDNDGDTQSLLD
uniref:Chloride channel protein n=1 Tax=Parastrongyloides trichosuri TaxID=131310 RepID=A0A0N4ZZZ1_PARTI